MSPSLSHCHSLLKSALVELVLVGQSQVDLGHVRSGSSYHYKGIANHGIVYVF